MFPLLTTCRSIYHILYDGISKNFTCQIVTYSSGLQNRVSCVSLDQVKETLNSIFPFVSMIDAVLIEYINSVTFPQQVHIQLCECLRPFLDESVRILVSPIHFGLYRDIREVSPALVDKNLVVVNWKGKSTPLKNFVLLSKKNGILMPLRFAEKPELDSLDFNTLVVAFDVGVSQRGLQKVQKVFPQKTVFGVPHNVGPLTEDVIQEYFFNSNPDRLHISSYLGISILIKADSHELFLDKNFVDNDDPQQYVILNAGVASFAVWIKYFGYSSNELYKTYKVAPMSKSRLLVIRIKVDEYLVLSIEYDVVEFTMPGDQIPVFIDPHFSHNYLYATTMMSIKAPVVNCILDSPFSIGHYVVYPQVDSLINSYETNEELIIDLMLRTPPSTAKLTIQEYYESSTICSIHERLETLKLGGYTNLKLLHPLAMTWTCILRAFPFKIAVGQTVAIISMIRTVVLKRCKNDFEVVLYFWIAEQFSVLPSKRPLIYADYVILDNTHLEYDVLSHSRKKSFLTAHKNVKKEICSLFWNMAYGNSCGGFLIHDFADLVFYVVAKNGLNQSFETKLVTLPFIFTFNIKFYLTNEIEVRVGNSLNPWKEHFLIKRIQIKQHPLAVAASLKLTVRTIGPWEFKVVVDSMNLLFRVENYLSLSKDKTSKTEICSPNDHDIFPRLRFPDKVPAQTISDSKTMVHEYQQQMHFNGDKRCFRSLHCFRRQLICMSSEICPQDGSMTADVFLSWTTQNTIEIHKICLDYNGKTVYPAYVSFKDGIHFGEKAFQDFQNHREFCVFDIYKILSDECTIEPFWPFRVEFAVFDNYLHPYKVITHVGNEVDLWSLFTLITAHVVDYVKKNSNSDVKTVVIQLPKYSTLVSFQLSSFDKNLNMKLCLLG